MPVSLPTYYAEHVACWQQPHLGLDFGAAQEAATNSIYWSRSKFAAATPLAPAQPLLHMDLDAAQSTHCRATTEFSLTTDGSLHGWLGWFRMQLGEAWLSTSPFEPLTHWGSAFLPLPQAQDGHAGDAAGFSLLRPPGGPWSWTTTLDGRVFRQSTFRAATLSPARLASLAEAAQPSLTPTGVCVRATLDAMDGATSIKEIASRLQAAHPEAVPDEASALRLIRDATDRYAARSPGPDDRVQPPAPPA